MARNKKNLEKLWAGKKKRRKMLSELPIEEKFAMVVLLQNWLYPALASRNPKHLRPWKLP